MLDTIIIGAGISGMATAARLQARGQQTLLLEAHGQIGGCAGFFTKRGFTFDVGATTLVDFGPGGVGGRFLDTIGLSPLDSDPLPGYKAWLPDRTITLHRDTATWHKERLATLGSTPNHHRFWRLLDQLAAVFWQAARLGIKLPIHKPPDLLAAIRTLPPPHWPLLRYLRWTMADALKQCHLTHDLPLRGLLSMLIEDTIHSTIDHAPLINAALGITIRGTGLTRHKGGMRGFWQKIIARYKAMNGRLRVGQRVLKVNQQNQTYTVHTQKTTFQARQIVSTLPIWNTAEIAPTAVQNHLRPYLQRDEAALGSALVLFLGLPEEEVADQEMTHHQILLDYHRPLGNGNNMFISVSAPGDTASAPPGHRAVMLSTHCDLSDWENLSEADYHSMKSTTTHSLLTHARRVYPNLAQNPIVNQLGTPRTYQKYTHRYRGAVGGLRLTLNNSNQSAVPYKTPLPGFWQTGDTTWPGLGTVACVLASQHVAEGVMREAKRGNRIRRKSTVHHVLRNA